MCERLARVVEKTRFFWDVGALRTARKPLKWSHQVVFRRENKDIDTVVFIRWNQPLKVGGTIQRVDGVY